MPMRDPRLHFGAFALACVLVFVLQIQDRDIGLLHRFTDAPAIRVYTPYFPGMAQIEQHEIFSPAHAGEHKIVLLGASAIDSVSCDGTWSFPDPARQPDRNAHYSCTIAYQLTQQLHAAGYGNWQAFDLARNGAKLTPMLYVYARIAALKPDIVIFGDTFPYYRAENADAATLTRGQYEYLDRAFGQFPETAATWNRYRKVLEQHGLDRAKLVQQASAASPQSVTLSDLIVHVIALAHNYQAVVAPPLPVSTSNFRSWAVTPIAPGEGADADPGMAYFQGVTLIGDMQRRIGKKFLVYFSPQYDRRHDTAYLSRVDTQYGSYLAQHGDPYLSLIALPLKPDTETFDGVHQTIYGNRVIAAALLRELKRRNMMTP